ncbi:MAG TPA: nucleotidyltransferase domain-containing protein [Candidatus Eisenbacteria bacterium]
MRDRLLEMARADARVTAGAIVGSLAGDGGDRWSDLDLSFGLAPGATPAGLLTEWTPRLERELGAVPLFDLPFQSSLYRVFLLPGQLQVDLSFTPGAEFGALGPRFTLLFGEAVTRTHVPPPSAATLFGLGAHHAVRARFCLERGRLWQAEYWISGARDQALALACLRHGLEPRHGRGDDDLPAGVTVRFTDALVRSIDRHELLRALGSAIEALLRESRDVREVASRVEVELRALVSPGWPDR